MRITILKNLGILVIAFMGLTACSDDQGEFEFPSYDEIENERVIAELDNVPAYVYDSFRDCVIISYSEYADEYYTSENKSEFSIEMLNDIEEHQIGVKRSDFDIYGISFPTKVYISASVTNNRQIKINPNELDPYFVIFGANKAYLKDLKPRY